MQAGLLREKVFITLPEKPDTEGFPYRLPMTFADTESNVKSDGLGGWLLNTATTSVLSDTFSDTFYDTFSGDITTPIQLPKPIAVWANVKELDAKESLTNGKVVTKQPFKITIRYNSTIDTTCNVEWNNKKLGVNSVVADARKTYMVLTCYANS